jgi:hypothetical protein
MCSVSAAMLCSALHSFIPFIPFSPSPPLLPLQVQPFKTVKVKAPAKGGKKAPAKKAGGGKRGRGKKAESEDEEDVSPGAGLHACMHVLIAGLHMRSLLYGGALSHSDD